LPPKPYIIQWVVVDRTTGMRYIGREGSWRGVELGGHDVGFGMAIHNQGETGFIFYEMQPVYPRTRSSSPYPSCTPVALPDKFFTFPDESVEYHAYVGHDEVVDDHLRLKWDKNAKVLTIEPVAPPGIEWLPIAIGGLAPVIFGLAVIGVTELTKKR
jgi:hypothetical protein